jgi:hypothetical protein
VSQVPHAVPERCQAACDFNRHVSRGYDWKRIRKRCVKWVIFAVFEGFLIFFDGFFAFLKNFFFFFFFFFLAMLLYINNDLFSRCFKGRWKTRRCQGARLKKQQKSMKFYLKNTFFCDIFAARVKKSMKFHSKNLVKMYKNG